MPISAMVGGLNSSDLGYDLGYLGHGSFGRGYAGWPGRLRRVALDATNGLARRSGSPAEAARCAAFLRPRSA